MAGDEFDVSFEEGGHVTINNRVTVTEREFSKLLDRLDGFAQDMREQGIHVGMGDPPKCVTCDEAWPCEGSKG